MTDEQLLAAFRSCSDAEQVKTLRGAICAAESGELGGWCNHIPVALWDAPSPAPAEAGQ